MKKLFAVLLMVSILLRTVACGKAEKPGRRTDSHAADESIVDIGELRTYEGPMFELTSTVRAPVPDDFDRDYTVTIYYDASLVSDDYYLPQISNRYYMTIYRFCVNSLEEDTFADYYEEVDDGQTYRFTFYDEEGTPHVIYDGYTYDNAELSAIIDLVFGMQPI